VARNKLSAYHSKRDFNRTREPVGSVARGNGNALRYVIQKHAARRLHYDLRLELDGVFKSWAVTRGPSLNPADKRLAVEVEDHPLDYGDFEGTIPAGQYGGGTVQLWDRGYWQPANGVAPAKALKSGELKFDLEGQRLHGGWVLVRMRHDRNGGKRNNWLLIKHRDAAAVAGDADTVLQDDRSVASGRAMAQIAAGRGKAPTPFMRARHAAVRADAVWQSAGAPRRAAGKSAPSSAMPQFIEPQLATLVSQPPSSAQWVHEVKLDGYRIQLRVQSARAQLRTRKGLDWSDKFPEIVRAGERLPDCILDGEIVALNSAHVPDFAALQAALSERKTDKLEYFAFDLLYLDGKDLRAEPLSQRKPRLRALLRGKSSGAIRYVEDFAGKADAVLNSACRMALEGIVSKRLDAPYSSGRVGSWSKSKCRAGHEVVIGGYTFRDGAPRSLLVGVYRDERLVYVGRVGTGFGQQSARLLWARLKTVTAKRSPFAPGVEAPRDEPAVRWVRPTLVAEIEFAGWTGSGMVRQAAFKGLRADKPAREVQAERPSKLVRDEVPSLRPRGERPQKTRRSARPGPTSGAGADAAADEVLKVRISQPDKPLWPDAGDRRPVTKLDLAQYYAEVGAWLMPHIEGRPCSLVRAPDGIDGQRFFQRHASRGMSNLFESIKVRGEREPYVGIDRIEALIAAVQIAALELHPWNCVAGRPEVPGRLVFDLDPAPDVSFDAVVRAANELHERLEHLGLPAFCKTTGGKGLHVVTPLAPQRKPLDWATGKAGARAICEQMAADSPDRFVMTMSKKERTGRIFLDYLRNDRTATAVAPLSTRARPGATVSMPLSWSQVRAGLKPERFTLRTAPALIKRDRPWTDYAKAEGSLRSALERLNQSGGARARPSSGRRRRA
jgi:bifunctional non-homologous end joining protein LigD